MQKISHSFIAKVKTYLKKAELPYTRVPDTENILVLRSAGSHHYLLIQFYDMPKGWLEDRRYFDIKITKGIDYKQVTASIEKYLQGK